VAMKGPPYGPIGQRVNAQLCAPRRQRRKEIGRPASASSVQGQRQHYSAGSTSRVSQFTVRDDFSGYPGSAMREALQVIFGWRHGVLSRKQFGVS
jgi:hypothetical protein